MFIPYEKIGKIINLFIKNEKLQKTFYDKKVEQNVRYIEKNRLKVINKLKNKLKKRENLNVVFYVYDNTKWKCQSLYDMLDKDDRFDVKVLVTKTACENPENSSYISNLEIEKTYNFFKQKGINVEYAYDIDCSKFIPFKKFKPDIIFYQHPWYVKTEQGPVVCSKYALTGYIPYYFPIELSDIDYNLRFHRYVEKYYVLDDYTKNRCVQNVPELQHKLRVVGYPHLDNFKMNDTEENYIIYAPHWTIGGNGVAFGTFAQNGRFILDYAKTHPEMKWIFKPHPLLRKALIDFGIMSYEEVQNYYSEWEDLGIKCESGDYLELFAKSKMMITDSASFLGEYFVTGKPLIHLLSEKSLFRYSENPILKTYYRVNNIAELENILNKLPENDEMREMRNSLLEELGLKKNCASKKILDDILKELY